MLLNAEPENPSSNSHEIPGSHRTPPGPQASLAFFSMSRRMIELHAKSPRLRGAGNLDGIDEFMSGHKTGLRNNEVAYLAPI